MDIVSFVILHYKDLAATDRCVQSILRMEQQERIRIVIVDNDICESEEKREALRRKYAREKRIDVLKIKENGGFSYANNRGYRYAREKQRASSILVLNNDIEFVQDDFISRLDDSYKGHPCHVLGPDVIRRSTGEHQNPMDQRIRTKEEAEYTIRMNRTALKYYAVLYPLLYWKNKRNERKQTKIKRKNWEYYQSVQKNIVPFGACFIFTPKFVAEETIAFYPETRFYYEEYLLTYRCQKRGYEIIYDPALKAVHESGTATRKSLGSEKRRLRFMMERVAEACEVYRETIK